MITHICVADKFIQPFIEFIKDNFNIKQHRFIILNENLQYPIKYNDNVILIKHKRELFSLLGYLHSSKKIILHGLWSEKINILLLFQPWLLKKCYWIMWGGDFYLPETQGWVKKETIKRIAYLCTGTTGDYTLAVKWYKAKGKHIKCFNYPSNLYKKYDVATKKNKTINIQVGNSSDSGNHHMEIFEKLKLFKNSDIKIIAPLSYGDDIYANKIIQEGNEIFNKKFEPLVNFIPFEKYLSILAQVDIAIFNHRRQQAMGNIVTLLGLGKKVYIHHASTLNGVFKEYNIKVYDTENIDLAPMDNAIKQQNIKNIKNNFSDESLVNSLSTWIN